MTSLAAQRDRRKLEALHYELRWRQASSDFETFARDCLIIERKDTATGYGPFVLEPHQQEFLRQLRTNDALMNLKARQLGISTLTLSVMLFRAVTTPGFKGLVLNHKDDYAKAAVERLRSLFEMMPAWVRERLPKPNDAAGNFVLDFGGGRKSVITAQPITKTVGASTTLDMVLFDEAALAEYAREAYNSMRPTLDAIRKAKTGWAALVIVSTARGSTNWFAQMWKRGGIAKVFFPWHASPIYDQADYDKDLASATATGELQEFYQERPVSAQEAFRMTGTSRFKNLPEPDELDDSGHIAGKVVRDDAGNASFEPDPDGHVWLAELPVPGRRYVLAVDPAHGKEKDYTVGTLHSYGDDGLPSVAGYWRSNTIEQIEAAEELMDLGWLFAHRGKPALLAVEFIQGGTMLTVMRQGQNRYPNLYRYASTTAVAKNMRYEYGFPTNKATKPRIIDLLASTLPTLRGLWPEAVRELHAFVVKDNGKMEADTRHDHDDIVDSIAIGLWVLTYGMSTAPQPPMGETAPRPASKPLLPDLYEEAARADAKRRRAGREAWRRLRQGW